MILVTPVHRGAALHLPGAAFTELIAVDPETGERYPLPLSEPSTLDYAALEQALPPRAARYGLLARAHGAAEWLGLTVPAHADLRPWERVFRADESSSAESLHVFIDPEGHLGVRVRTDVFLDHAERRFDYDHELLALDLERGEIRAEVALTPREAGEFTVERSALRLHSTHERIEILGEHELLGVDGATERWIVRIPLPPSQALTPLRYVLYLTLRESRSGKRIHLRIDHLSAPLFTRLHESLLAPQLRLAGGRVLAVATTPKTTLVSFVVRELAFDDRRPLRTRAAATFARLEVRARRLLRRPRRATALIFEKNASTAQDNGIALFRHLLARSTDPGFDFYFVMDRESPQWDRVVSLPRVVRKYSLRHWRLLVSPTTFLLSSDVRYHLSHLHAQPGLLDKLLYLRKNYFLQHGVLGLKRIGLLRPSSAVAPDATVVSAEWERELARSAGAQDASLDVVGLARWDGLERAADASPRPLRRILFMPTWREWLEGQSSEELRESEFAQSLQSFLSAPELDRLLEAQGAQLVFLPHPKLAPLSRALSVTGSRVIVLRQEDVDFTELVSASDLVITDYSSIAWDFVWAGKSAVLAQFDRAQHLASPGEYASEAFTDVLASLPLAETPARLLDVLQQLMEEEPSTRDARNEARARQLFPFLDSGNAARVVDAVARRIPELREPRRMPQYTDADALYLRQRKRSRA